MQVDGHAGVGRVVVHVAHHHDLYPRVLLHHVHGMAVDDLSAAAPQVAALASDTGRKVRHVYGEILPVNPAVDHEYVPGLEGILQVLAHGEFYVAVECERDGLAVQVGELVRPVEQPHVHAPGVRAVIVDNLVVGPGYLRLADKVLQHKAVFYLTDTQYSMERPVFTGHCTDDGSHIVQFLLVLGICPLVLSLGQELLVVLCRIVECVEQILEVVEPDYIVLCRGICIKGK